MIMGICLKLDVLVLLILAVSVTANWMRQYKYFIHGGCPAYSCKRVCMQNELLSVTPGDNGFYFEISEMNNQENYIPEKTYKSENQIGQLWTFAEISRVNTSGGEGVKILHTEKFEVQLDQDNCILAKCLPDCDHTKASKSFKSNMLTKENNIPKTNQKEEEINVEENRNSEDSEDTENFYSEKKAISKNGLYTIKDYYMASKFPWYIRKILPDNLATIHERSWNMYPSVKTVLTNDYFKNNFRIQLDTVTLPAQLGGICDENAHNLTPEQLAKREIIVIDIAEPVSQSDYTESEDPMLFKSLKSGRGPLTLDWIKRQQPLICVHKLATIEFKVFGLQTKVENYIKNMYTQMFKKFHRQVFCFMDNWHGLKLSDIRQIEENLAKLLLKKIEEGEITKCVLLQSE